MSQLEIHPTNKQQEILDSILEQALIETENSEGIKSGIVRNGARDLVKAGVKKSKIARLLVYTVAKNRDLSKKTRISRRLVYKVLREPAFKELKGLPRGHGKWDLCTGAQRPSASPTCGEILALEVNKLRAEKPELSNKEIRKLVSKLDSIKQYSPNTIRRLLQSILPLEKQTQTKSETVDGVAQTAPPGISQYTLDQQQLEADLIKRIGILQQVTEWLSGLEEWERREFEKTLPKGKPYSLGLQDKCRNHIITLLKMMPDSYVGSFLRYCDELTHLTGIWGEKLYEEKLLRENRRNMSLP